MTSRKRPKRRPRQCGNCQMCCEHVGVAAMNKPPRQRCPHQCPIGCAIYRDRPGECAVYTCSWLEGIARREDRPDKSGILLETFTLSDSDGRNPFHVYVGFILDDRDPDEFQPVFESIVKPGTIVIILRGVDDGDPVIVSETQEDHLKGIRAIQVMAEGEVHLADGVYHAGEARPHTEAPSAR